VAHVDPGAVALAVTGLDLAGLFGASVALAHGIPWDSWLMNADGSDLHRAAETGADEPSVRAVTAR